MKKYFPFLLEGAKNTGTFTEGLRQFEENFTFDDFEEANKFCQYIDNEIGGAGRANIEQLYEAFSQPYNKEAQETAVNIKQKIQEINNRTRS